MGSSTEQHDSEPQRGIYADECDQLASRSHHYDYNLVDYYAQHDYYLDRCANDNDPLAYHYQPTASYKRVRSLWPRLLRDLQYASGGWRDALG